MSLMVTERMRRDILGVRFCQRCECETLMLDNGTCGFCDEVLEKPKPAAKRRPGRPRSMPSPPTHVPGFCDFCGGGLPKHKSKFCKEACKQAYWVRFTAKGRAWVARQNDRKAAA